MVRDPQRKLYEIFGLSRSIAKSFGIKVLRYYGQQSLKEQLPEAHAQDDFLQLGGDFTVKDGRTVTFCYPSQNASDRPEVGQVLQAIKEW